MAHDYQYWRRSRRTNTAPYRFFSIKSGGPDVAAVAETPPIATTMSERYPLKPRTANTAYWRQNAAVVGDDVFVHTQLPARAPTKARTANTAYWCHNEAMIGDDVFVHTRLPERAPTKLRSANTAYWQALRFQINDEVPQNGRIFSPNPPVRRTANAAYFVNPTAVVADVTNLPPIVPVITDFARPKARTANAAYWQALRFQINDEVPQNGRIFSLPPPVRRTAHTGYTINERFVVDDAAVIEQVIFPTLATPLKQRDRTAYYRFFGSGGGGSDVTPPVVVDPPPIFPFISDIYRPRRTANTAYWRNASFVIDDVVPIDPPTTFPFISDIARRHRYNSATAPWRWIGSRGGGLDVEPPITFPSATTLFDYRRSKLRSARQNYQFAGARQLALAFKPEGMILFPEHNNTWRRRKEAANTAYWRPNTGQIVYVDFGAELSAKLLPQRYWTPLRTANTAYWKNNPGPIPVIDFLEELSAKLIPNRAPGARRGVNTIYSVTSRYMEDTVAFDSVIGAILLPDRVYQQQRASEFAYWMPPPFLVQFPAPLAPLIISKARAQVLWANDREFLIPAKRRKFPQKPKRP